MPSTTLSKNLFVFDFDWTLIEADSDHWVMEKLGGLTREEFESTYKDVQWTDLQDMLLGRLFDRGVTKAHLEATLREIPMMPETIAALQLMKAQGSDLVILSDANTFYVDTILKAHGIDHLFSKIITNPSHFDEQGRLRVARFHGLDKPPHGCPRLCAPNLCKGQEFQKVIASQHWEQIVYMGDSTNDFCPSTRLQSNGIVLARANLLLEKAIREHPDMVKAQVIYWSSPKDVLAATQAIFDVPSPKSLVTPALAVSEITQSVY
ncbi:pyridoxal phosphate phosphatase PHOSPHO2 [Entomortierella parvispora]|uniref:Pyridoxal phosphate phosphatase PHOSPHO2 n=1 Tax=Entomortierella parvispora TaxID=205924 RepID=A0A9P3LX08_9FUNG|nr:pyridoxal phosphate phosphatase PHOSPHO2 [Entomortierella parvispora]